MDDAHIKARARAKRYMDRLKADSDKYDAYRRKWAERKRELEYRYLHKTPSEAFVKTVKQLYADIAAGKITQEQAAEYLGYTSFKTLDHARWDANLPPLSAYGWNPNGYNRITPDEMEKAYMRIAHGEDREKIAKECGFVDYEHMEKKRMNLGCPPLKYWKQEYIKERYEERMEG